MKEQSAWYYFQNEKNSNAEEHLKSVILGTSCCNFGEIEIVFYSILSVKTNANHSVTSNYKMYYFYYEKTNTIVVFCYNCMNTSSICIWR